MDLIKRFWADKWNQIWLFAIVFVVGLGAIGYIMLGRGARQAVLDTAEINQRLLLHSGSAAFQTFLSLASDAVIVEAHNPLIYSGTAEEKQKEIQRFINTWEGTAITETIITDDEGLVTHIANRQGSAFTAGISAADREYFKRASQMKRGEAWIGEPIMPRLGAFQGRHVISIAAPIHNEDEEFLGVMSIAVGLSEMTEEFVLPLKVHTDADLFLLRGDGVLLYAPDSELIGKNVYDIIRESKGMSLLGVLEAEVKRRFERGVEGSLTAIIPGIGDGKIKERLIAYHPVKLSTIGPACNCMLVKTVPTATLLAATGPVYVRGLLLLALVMLGLMMFAIRIAKVMGFEEGMVYEKYLKKENRD